MYYVIIRVSSLITLNCHVYLENMHMLCLDDINQIMPLTNKFEATKVHQRFTLYTDDCPECVGVERNLGLNDHRLFV